MSHRTTSLGIGIALTAVVILLAIIPGSAEEPQVGTPATETLTADQVEAWIGRIQTDERVQLEEVVDLPTDSGTETTGDPTVDGHLGLLEGVDLARAIETMEGLVKFHRGRVDDQPTGTLKENRDAAMALYRYEQALAALSRLNTGTYLVMENGEKLSVPNSQTMVYPVRKEGRSVDAVFLLDEATFPQLGALRSHADDLRKQILIDHIATFNAKSLEERRELLEKVLPLDPDEAVKLTSEDRGQRFLTKREIAPSGTRINERLWILELDQNR